MKTVNSLSGGKSSSYIAANYPADYNVFALVRTNNKNCIYPDKKVRQIVSDKIGTEFIGTLEQDNIIKIMLNLEQKIGNKIIWLSENTFENIISQYKGKDNNYYLPNIMTRYCTQDLKMKPIIKWWQNEVNEIVKMRIGFRKGEEKRASKTISKLTNGVEISKMIIGKRKTQNKWGGVAWRIPEFPLIENNITNDIIVKYWENNNIGFEKGYYNNCVGCFHRNPLFLKKMSLEHKNKIDWFVNMEQENKPNTFIKDFNYSDIQKINIQTELSFDDFSECDSGYCGL